MNIRKRLALLVAASLMLVSQSALAILIQVDWEASLTPVNPNFDPSPGTGNLSGSFGVFDVTAAGDTFILPADGSLSVIASGFTSGFPNGSYSLTRKTSADLLLEFLAIGTSAADISVQLVNNNAGILSPSSNACTIGGIDDDCFVSVFDENSTGTDIAVASVFIGGSLDDSSIGPIEYSFVVKGVPEPGILALLSIGLAGIGYQRRKQVKPA